ncbi:MAG: Stp1/IreP family PP2C-type Ser/Thr phosphatase [Faecalibacterium sp.]|nr:Stp1/IreP family PP2C-type Ser/Thr phosphatase [Faecalibacterium sp.]
MRIAAITDIGAVRRENQDDFRACQQSDSLGWAVVCDGMGGARGGKIASRVGCDSVQQFFAQQLADARPGQEDIFLTDALQYANRKIYDLACQNPEIAGMGTTAVCLLVRGPMAHLCHAGDSRAYLSRGGVLRQVTHDHSYVQELVDSGTITPQQAEHHPKKNVITRALGVEATLRPEYTSLPVQKGDILLLCSDGLSNAVPATQIQNILETTPFYEAPARLIEAANFNGGPDNITALLVQLESEVTHG